MITRAQLRPSHLFSLLIIVFVASSLILPLVHHTMVIQAVSITSGALLISYMCIAWNSRKNTWWIRLWAWVTGLTPVQIMDFTHEVTYTLVKQMPDQSYEGYLSFHFQEGGIRLLPNGFVDPDCDMSFCYIWHPLDSQLQTQLQLSYSDVWPNWDAWRRMDHVSMMEHRFTHVHHR